MKGKPPGPGSKGGLRSWLRYWCCLPPPAWRFAQGTTERVVVNRFTGQAISGYDPVAYFTDTAAVRGDERFEAVHDGAVWRFRNEGNRAAFVGHPEVYAPQFGGHDPVDVARGKVVQSLPQLWTDPREAAVSVRERDKPHGVCGEPGRICEVGGAALAEAEAGAGAVGCWCRRRDRMLNS